MSQNNDVPVSVTPVPKYKFKKQEIIGISLIGLLQSSSISFTLKPLNSKSKILRIIWLVFILAALIVSIYYFVLNILDFLKYDTITSINQVYESKAEFPTVSFCSAFQNDTSFDISILKLNFNSLSLTNQSNQWKDYFEAFNDTYYNQCYRFNSGKTLTNDSKPILFSILKGPYYGLQLDFYFQTKNPDYGQLAIFIHNRTMPPPSLYSYADTISAGTSYFFAMDRTLNVKLPQPYNNCFKDISQFPLNKTLIDYMEKRNRKYSQDDCLYLCGNLIFNEQNNCGCSFVSLDDFNPKCNATGYILNECSILQTIYSKDQYEMCADYCPLECESYSLESNQRVQPIILVNDTLSSDFMYPEFKTFTNFSRNFYSINVYYSKLKYTYISQSPKLELFGLISNLGGLFSLFLGFSFVSLMDLFEIIFFYLRLVCSN